MMAWIMAAEKNMEYATGWVAKKVTSHQIVYCIAYHSVNIMVETRWLRSANSGFLMIPVGDDNPELLVKPAANHPDAMPTVEPPEVGPLAPLRAHSYASVPPIPSCKGSEEDIQNRASRGTCRCVPAG